MSCPTEQQPSVASPTITENWDSSLHFVTLRMTKYTVQKLFRHPLRAIVPFLKHQEFTFVASPNRI
ncbi:hypothetical protein [Nostoc sp.]|uniref:hypothetical protein n=1 Tax=Nostoc sp. TaxID=1180 RepID=UPI002FF8FE74